MKKTGVRRIVTHGDAKAFEQKIITSGRRRTVLAERNVKALE